jgi:flavin-binding protein dodecin
VSPQGGPGKPGLPSRAERRNVMSVSTYKIIEVVATSEISWEDAAKNAVKTASKSLRDLRIAEVKQFDMRIENGKVAAYRVRLDLSFKYDGKE